MEPGTGAPSPTASDNCSLGATFHPLLKEETRDNVEPAGIGTPARVAFVMSAGSQDCNCQ
ncbi:hypothetical protein Q669_15210 [Labrenzia sp. C1B10]|nr:hypothetical protein Q669_15210 [Labrenzia sp. C1B10]ERS06575.1 hypothetical protein Q675_25330 [Labrenzia sp. C1B70]